jgi:hypothetical protein
MLSNYNPFLGTRGPNWIRRGKQSILSFKEKKNEIKAKLDFTPWVAD